ncbi:MAG: aminotransferase class V-fold PLP-dependent enzyme [Granulosicoccus sp.]|nr:aminotransferase class V-fold PLP-dependent enzyme [Granulosicoccus sp.]
MFDLDFVRTQFPAFSEDSLQGWAFFENAGGSYTCQQVIDRLLHFYTQTKVQPYGPYPAAQKGGAAMDDSYQKLAAYLNVPAEDVSFGPSTSQNTYVLSHAFRAAWSPGDEIVVTNQDHEANSGAWRRLADTGIVVREWAVDPETGELDPTQLDALLSEKTRLVAFPHCSNIVAHINPVADICARIHAAGAVAVVDGVSYAGHGFPDVKALGADVYLFSLYKTFGPHLGLMVVNESTRSAVQNQSHFFNANYPEKKLVPAGPDHAQIGAAGGIADYFDTVHAHHFPTSDAAAAVRGQELHTLFRQREEALLQPVLDYMQARNDLRLLGPADASVRAPTVAVAVQGSAEALAARLSQHKIMCWSGNFYAYRLVEALGLDPEEGALRMSFVHYTSAGEIEQLLTALDQEL